MKQITILGVTWNQLHNGRLPRFINCILNQTKFDLIRTIIYHDGPSIDGTREYMEEIIDKYPGSFIYRESEKREHDPEKGYGWGHFNRDRGIDLLDTKWVNFQNCDNEIESTMVECILESPGDAQIITWSQKHSYFGYEPFFHGFQINGCDMAQFAALSEIAKRIRFRYRDFAADGRFIEDIKRYTPGLKIKHIDKVLGTHN